VTHKRLPSELGAFSEAVVECVKVIPMTSTTVGLLAWSRANPLPPHQAKALAEKQAAKAAEDLDKQRAADAAAAAEKAKWADEKFVVHVQVPQAGGAFWVALAPIKVRSFVAALLSTLFAAASSTSLVKSDSVLMKW